MQTDTASPTTPRVLGLTSLGALELSLESVEHRIFPPYDSASRFALSDGTEVRALESATGLYLLVDHRRDPFLPARVELWRPTAAPEMDVAGVYALCDALKPH
jgi:hypothetical protein